MFGIGVLKVVILAVGFIVGLFIYLLPSVMASNKKHSKIPVIVFLNIFLGWTLLVWVACLIWANIDGASPSKSYAPASRTKTCS